MSQMLRTGCVLVLLVAPAAWGDARSEARRHFRAGMALIAEGGYDAGIAELLEAYAIRPHPNVLFNVARAHEAAGHPAEALGYYQQYLRTRPPDAAEVEATVAGLEARLAATSRPPAQPPPPPSPGPAPPGVDEATARRLAELTERLERAVARAESVAERPAASEAPPGQGEPAAAPEDFGVPYEETVVAASRRAQSVVEAPSAITVITQDEIRASGLRTLPEILRRVPGAEVMVMGYSSANVSFRGFNQRVANKVLLLIDGRPEYHDFIGATLWPVAPIGIEEIERIEVIRGPGSALYGANAMLGVINVITRAPGSGPRAELDVLAGNGNQLEGSLVASGGDRLVYRASVGYRQGDKFSRDFAEGRPDVAATSFDPDLGLRNARGNLTLFYPFSRDFSVALSGGVNRIYTELYALGLLRNYQVDGTAGYLKLDFTGGPLRARFFWNTLDYAVGPQYEPVGQRTLATTVTSNVVDGELFFQKDFTLGGTHVLAAGISARLKLVNWGYIGAPQQEVHAAAFIQDEWRIVKPLSVVASYRIDRHPLLDRGNPGYAQSPRVSVVVMPADGHALRASFATAFRQPTFLESYMDIRVPVPGVPGASVLTQGDRALRPERLLSFEVGYRGDLPLLGLTLDVAGYWNIVNDLAVLSPVSPLPAGESYDPVTGSYLLGRSVFTNDPGTYHARGGELGVTWSYVRGLDIRLSGGLQSIVSATEQEVCVPCSQAPVGKLNASFVYRTPVNLDLSADVTYTSSTTWVEREPLATDPTRVVNLSNPLAGFTVINARIAYRLFDDRLTVAVVGSQLGPDHQEHPFGNLINRRIMGQITVRP